MVHDDRIPSASQRTTTADESVPGEPGERPLRCRLSYLPAWASAPLHAVPRSVHQPLTRSTTDPYWTHRRNTMTAQITSAQADLPGRRMAVSLSALAVIGYAAAWIISLSVGAPNPSVAASGSQVVAAFAGRSGPGLAMFALAEGVAAIVLVAVMTSAARAAPPLQAGPGRTDRCRLRDRCGSGLLGRAGPGYMADQRTGAGPADRHCRGHIPRDHADGRGEDVPAGRDGSGHFPAGPTLTHPASLAGAPGSPAGRSPDDVRAGLPASHPGPCLSGVRVRGPTADIRLCYRNSPAPSRRPDCPTHSPPLGDQRPIC